MLAGEFAQLLFLLVAGHAIADFPLQGEAMSRAKAGREPGRPWYMALACHGLIHGGFVAIVLMATGHGAAWWCGIGETVAHMAIDHAKARRRFGIKTDQLFHLDCKLLWALLGVVLA